MTERPQAKERRLNSAIEAQRATQMGQALRKMFSVELEIGLPDDMAALMRRLAQVDR